MDFLRAGLSKWIAIVSLGLSFVQCPTQAWAGLDDSICAAASAFLAQRGMAASDGLMMFATVNAANAGWTPAPVGSPVVLPSQANQAFLAYFINRPGAPVGAIAARISLKIASLSEKRVNYVDVYRRAIDRGTNSCEPRGLAKIDRQVKVNAYIDFHDPSAGGVNSTLEDFHFKYPREAGCAKTNDRAVVSSFQFEDVMRTEGDNVIARYFPVTGTALAQFKVNHEFSALRSELHYPGSPACIGLFVPLHRSPQASVVINEQGFGTFPTRKNWLIGH